MEYSVTVTSSIEYPKNMSFVIFLAKCPLRCPYCSNSEILEEGTEISLEEIYEKIDDSAMFMDAVVVSGGEPLVQYEDVIEIFKYVREIGLKTKLDTSGVYPDRLQKILDLGLVDYVAMDIKNSPEGYGETVGVPRMDISNVEQSVKFLLEGEQPYEFRTTVVRELHSALDIEDMGVWLAGDHKHYLQGFIDSGDLIGKGLSGYDKNQMQDLVNVLKAYIPRAQARGV